MWIPSSYEISSMLARFFTLDSLMFGRGLPETLGPLAGIEEQPRGLRSSHEPRNLGEVSEADSWINMEIGK